MPNIDLDRSKERSFLYILIFTLLYGLTLLLWPLIAFAMGMSLAAPTPPEYEVASRLEGTLLMTYPIGVIAAIISGWASYHAKRYIFPYWIMQLPLLWFAAWILVSYLGTALSEVPFLR
ncbi:hypothetical protein [Paenibacillus xylanilyticus]|uniref:Uncharacterized protein n=1 Tax=Paenibacillus xylanilyticus TaxID=248903 RepID=A0A7Y6BZU8_9BACL|nr:hypothetical protein [Paenibacillus xylanilyticus]NUU78014.1 hypothetical protein [Paenibacillus xylanilyticus]